MMLPRDIGRRTARPLAARQLAEGRASVRGGVDEGGSSMVPVIVGISIALVGIYFALSSDVGSQAEWNARYGK